MRRGFLHGWVADWMGKTRTLKEPPLLLLLLALQGVHGVYQCPEMQRHKECKPVFKAGFATVGSLQYVDTQMHDPLQPTATAGYEREGRSSEARGWAKEAENL